MSCWCRLSRVMFLLQHAIGTTNCTHLPRNKSSICMGIEDQHGPQKPANLVGHPETGSQEAFSVASMDLFASLDMDALLGSAATAATHLPSPITSGSSAPLSQLGQSSFRAFCRAPYAGSKAVPHQPHLQASQVSVTMQQLHQTQMPQASTAQVPLVHPQAAPFNLLIAQTPAISIARGGRAYSAQPRQSAPAQVLGWTSISAPVGGSADKPIPSAQMGLRDEVTQCSAST